MNNKTLALSWTVKRLRKLHKSLEFLQREADDVFQDLEMIGKDAEMLHSAYMTATTESWTLLRRLEAELEEEIYE